MKKMVLHVSLLVFCVNAFADEPPTGNSKLRSQTVAVELQEELLGTLNGGIVNTETLAIGYYTNENSMIFMSRSYLTQRPFANEDKSFSANSVGIKYFVTDTLYMKVSASNRDISLSDGINQHLSANVTTIDAAVGIQQEVSRFTYGLDIVGFYSQPIAKTVEVDTLTSDDTRTSALSKSRAKALNVFIGWKF